MNESVVRRTVVIHNPNGLHLRPVKLFAMEAMKFASQITVRKADKSADGKSILDILVLEIVQGSQLEIECRGEDADTAAERLAALLAEADQEAYTEPETGD